MEHLLIQGSVAGGGEGWTDKKKCPCQTGERIHTHDAGDAARAMAMAMAMAGMALVH